MVADRCLVCYQDGDLIKPRPNLHEDFPVCSLISKELHAMFILRNIFEVPQEYIQEYLETGANPSDWIALCPNCKSFVEKAKRIYKEILDASKRFRKVKGDIIQCLRRNKRRLQGNEKRKPSSSKSGMRITDETRAFVSEHNYSESLVDPFVGGDCQAEKLLYSSNVVPAIIDDEDLNNDLNVKIEYISPDEQGEDEAGSPQSYSFNDDLEDLTQTPSQRAPAKRKAPDSVVHEDSGPQENSNGEVLWYCSCGRSYCGSEKLRRHLKEANMDPSEMFDCPICDKQFKRKWDVKRHMKHHRVTIVEEIKVTSVKGNIPAIKKDRELDIIEQDLSLPASEAPSTSNSTAGNNVLHERKDVCKMADGTEYWNCSCGKIYLSEVSLLQHVNESSSIQISNSISCPICDLTFKMRFDRNRHMKKVHGTETAAVQEYVKDNQAEGAGNKNDGCITASYSMQSESIADDGLSLDSDFGSEKHEELGLFEVTNGTEQWKCLCGKSYSSQGALHRHVKEKNMDPKSWIACEQCGKSFKRQSELKRHVGNVHEKKSYPCEKCGSIFKQLAELRVHQRRACTDDPSAQEKTVCDTSLL